eukprot:TRINITY_DN7667_c0_g1_i1.p1 TRINITY_DN7667_c0_g1~~TRINITY_DN7667_c0_g1_i1.p1  ORF type:complete len:344 (+),score=36.30 TRINITY_DN7667_c0_g1_i1:63-1034(+)
MAQMVEFGEQGVVPSGGHSPPPAGSPDNAEKGGGVLGALKNKAEKVAATAAGAAVAYLQDAGKGVTGPWDPPGKDWPPEFKKKAFWYPIGRKGQVAHAMFPNRENKTTKHSKGKGLWATSEHGGVLCVWTRDCHSFLHCLGGYLYPISSVLLCMQRQKLLLENDENYECCQGLSGPKCSLLCGTYYYNCITENTPCLMCSESLFFPCFALHAHRWMIQSHYGLEDTFIDSCIMDVSCICRVPGDVCCNFPELEELGYILSFPFFGCLYAQLEYEMRARGYPYLGRIPGDQAMAYHSTATGCGYDGHVMVKKEFAHPHEGVSMT